MHVCFCSKEEEILAREEQVILPSYCNLNYAITEVCKCSNYSLKLVCERIQHFLKKCLQVSI